MRLTNRIERLMAEYSSVDFEFEPMPIGLNGLTVENQITVNSNIPEQQQFQWLLEEIGHVETSIGDISNYESDDNMKQENAARRWGYRHWFSHKDIERLKKEHPEDDYEIADELGVQLPYLHEAGITYGLGFKHIKD